MTRSPSQDAVLRTLAWNETLGYAPTRAELMLTCDVGNSGSCESEAVSREIDAMISEGAIVEQMGRIGFSENIDRIVETIRAREMYQPRKRRRARRVALWLSRLPSVRFIALANTTAIGHARDEGDLDFFVVVHAGTIWTTRLFSALPFRILGMTPNGKNARDAVCLSYFVTDDALDLSSHTLPQDDPYFRYWFLSLLPLYDDGVSRELWEANAKLRERHPCARRWIASPREQITGYRLQVTEDSCDALRSTVYGLPSPIYRLIEPLARYLQMRWFPTAIRDRMNRDTTVIVNDQTLKFHVTDGRESYRRTYYERCQKRGVAS